MSMSLTSETPIRTNTSIVSDSHSHPHSLTHSHSHSESDSESDDDDLEQRVVAKQQAEMARVEELSEDQIRLMAHEVNHNMVQFLSRSLDPEPLLGSQVDYEEEEDDDDDGKEEEDGEEEGNDREGYLEADDEINGLSRYLDEMEHELSSLMTLNSPEKMTQSRDSLAAMRHAPESPAVSLGSSMLDNLEDILESPSNTPISSVTNVPSPFSKLTSPLRYPSVRSKKSPSRQSRVPSGPPPSTSRRILQVAAGGIGLLTSYATSASAKVSTTATSLASYSKSELGKHIEGAREAWNSLSDIDENGNDIEEQKEIRYKSLLSCPTAVEITIPARSCSKIPFSVPAGKEISWRFLVKDFDIGFSVCLREKVYVLQGEGGAVENELLPYFTLSAFDKVNEMCCAEQVPRYFVFVLDNSYSTFRSKTLVYDVVISDAAEDEESDGDYDFGTNDTNDSTSESNSNLQSQPIDDDTNNYDDYTNNDYTKDQEYDQNNNNGENNVYYGDLRPSDIESGWGIYYDEDGNAYYYNHLTSVSQWEHPSSTGEELWCDEQQQQQPDVNDDTVTGDNDDDHFTDDDSFNDDANDKEQGNQRSSVLLDLVTLSSISKEIPIDSVGAVGAMTEISNMNVDEEDVTVTSDHNTYPDNPNGLCYDSSFDNTTDDYVK